MIKNTTNNNAEIMHDKNTDHESNSTRQGQELELKHDQEQEHEA